MPTLSIGMLAPVPILHAAFKLRTWTLWATAALYTLAEIVAFASIPEAESAEMPGWAGGIIVGLMIVPTVQAFAVRRRVFYPRHQDPAIAAALYGRQRRAEARDLAARDPILARELRIGRPDLPRRYDDGGLVDVNSAPIPVLVRWLGLSETDATQIVEARHRIGGFSSAKEIIAFTELSPAVLDAVVEDRMLFLR